MLLPDLPENMPTGINRFWAFIGRLVLGFVGWGIQGELPNLKKVVIIVAPHTSNWDFVIGMAAKMVVGVKANWLGKDAIFVGPAAAIFKSWGGIPVERSNAHDMVGHVVNEFRQRDKMWLGLSPEGTRTHVPQWKSGFWHIAKAAEVPIQAVAFDYASRRLVIGKVFTPGDDLQADMDEIRAHFADIGNGKIPENE